MPRFLFPAIILSVFSSVLIGYLLYFTSPFTGELPEIQIIHTRVILFLICLFTLITSLLSIFLFIIYRLLGDYVEPRFTYRKSLRQAAILGLGVISIAILLLTQTINLLTLGLTIAVVVSLEFSLK